MRLIKSVLCAAVVSWLLVLSSSTGSAQSLACSATGDRCSELWVPAQKNTDHSPLFKKGAIDVPESSIAVGDTLVAIGDLDIWPSPGLTNERISLLHGGSSVSIDGIRYVTFADGNSQIWLRITTPAKPTISPQAGNFAAIIAPPIGVKPPPQQVATATCPPTKGAAPLTVDQLLEGRDICYDGDGLIVHLDSAGKFDGGDTMQREGWYWLGVWIRQNTPGLQPWQPKRDKTFDYVLRKLEPNHDGVFYRHPTQEPYNHPYDKTWGTSRDQLVPMIAAMGVWGKKEELRRLWDALPEDLVGKHAFNGNWRNFLGQDGWNCSAVKGRSCSPTQDCSVNEDKSSCPVRTDGRKCILEEDPRSCPLGHDDANCGRDVNWGLLGKHHVNDPVCEAEKAKQNSAFAAQKAACDTAKTGQNAAYAASKQLCDAEKATQDALYAAEKSQCDSANTARIAFAAAQKASCVLAKSSGKAACEVDKAAATQLCELSNVFSGDIMGPAAINLFRRALGLDPMIPTPDDLKMAILHGGPEGEAELLANVYIRNEKSGEPSTKEGVGRDDVGDDLNLIVELLMPKITHPTTTSPISDEAARVYAQGRKPSYGSWLKAYYSHFGSDATNIKARMEDGIKAGWPTDVSPVYGAVRWYERPDSGANPQLGTLYSVIIDQFMK